MKIGDTMTDQRHPAKEPLPGFQEIHPMVFSGIYPINTADFEHLKTAIGKLRMNDSALAYEKLNQVKVNIEVLRAQQQAKQPTGYDRLCLGKTARRAGALPGFSHDPGGAHAHPGRRPADLHRPDPRGGERARARTTR